MTGPKPPAASKLAEICAMKAPLSAKLAAYAEDLRRRGSPFAGEYDTIVARLRSGEVGADAPKAGEDMPSFLLPDTSGRMMSLEELRAGGPVVISFNRGHWCPFCKIELTSLAAAEAELAGVAAKVVSIMPDRQSFVQPLAAELDGKVTIFSDIDNDYAISLGLAMWVGDRARALMEGIGWHLDQFQGNDTWLLPLPATFVVDKDGLILARFVDADFRERMEIEEVLAALQRAKR